MTETLIRQAKIFVVDDQEDGVVLLQQMLAKAGYANVYATTDSRKTLSMYQELTPDLLILDLHMPPPNGYEILDQLAVRPNKELFFPILVLTADITPIAKLKALSLGAKDFLTKPVEHVDLLLRVRNLLETRLLYYQLERERRLRTMGEADARARQSGQEILDRLATAMDCCDPRLTERAARVSETVSRLAETMGLPSDFAAELERAARIYDLGMLAVPAALHHKSGALSQDEKTSIRNHTAAAERILAGEGGDLELPRKVATAHHERWDGDGYPNGLKGDEIPLPARIVAVAEAFDQLTHPGDDRPPMTIDEALAEITRQSGFAFDPAIAAALQQSASMMCGA